MASRRPRFGPTLRMDPKVATTFFCLFALAWSGCASESTSADLSAWHLQHANYTEAYEVLLEDIAAGNDVDPGLLRRARLGSMLQRGQTAVFDDRPDVAIKAFEAALELDPDNEIAQAWMAKSRDKMAALAVRRGDDLVEEEDLEGALRAYHEATGHVADYPPALAGVARVAEIVAYREGRAQSQYIEGVRALGHRLYGTTWYHMVNAVGFDPHHERAKAGRDLANRRVIAARYERARELEEQGYYAACLGDYVELQERGADIDGLEARIEHMRREVAARRLIREAEMLTFKRQYDKARSALEEAHATSLSQQAEISELLILVKEQELSDRYDDGRVFELESRFDEALTEYRAIDEAWPGFLDVRTLISNLEAAIEIAKEAEQRGRAAEERGDTDAAIEAYEEALLVYPRYLDLEERIERLRARTTH